MKPIKMLGCVTLAALMTMALASVSSAMAESTALCTFDPSGSEQEVCPKPSLFSHIHEVSVGKGKLLTSIVTIECEVLFSGNVTSANNLGAPLEIEGNFTYPMTGCQTTSGTACEIKETSEHAFISVLKLGHELADVTGTAEVNAHCGALINCTYNGVGLVGHGLGFLLSAAFDGETRIEEQITNKTGGLFCPKTAKLDLLTTPLLATFITK